ncbi:amidohydrolase family protein [Rathayibacter soli]|uniref:amidohydrolase family protein n=1 Tax=Rathayibacter soli TaxID=3144168 RepID=UPI0027E4E058|nr:hypothetical protein [Glaciibacter superstes]
MASIPSATRPPTLVDRSTTEVDIHIPGTVFAHLTDHHVHLGLIEARALLPGGLTDVTDLGWEPPTAGGWLNSRDPALPAVRIAGGFLTCTGGYPSRSSWAPSGAAIELAAPTDAAGAVSAQAALGASVIKVTLNSVAGPVPSDALLAAIVTAAREHELPVVAHAEGVGQAERALDAGVTALAHTPFSERLADGVVGRMASAGLVWISTLDIHGWGRKTAAFEVASDNLRRFAGAGGRVLYGTDLGNGPLPVGVNQRELLALAEVGLDGDALVRSIAGSAEEAAFGPRFARVPGRPPGAARETAHWLATARGCTIDNPASFTPASFTTASPTTEDTIT